MGVAKILQQNYDTFGTDLHVLVSHCIGIVRALLYPFAFYSSNRSRPLCVRARVGHVLHVAIFDLENSWFTCKRTSSSTECHKSTATLNFHKKLTRDRLVLGPTRLLGLQLK